MTVVIDPGDDYCFFVPNITTGQTFDFDFEVSKDTVYEVVYVNLNLIYIGDGKYRS